MISYKEYLYHICKKTDLNDKESVTRAMQHLASEAAQSYEFGKVAENKLKELMSAKDFEAWSMEVGEAFFRMEVEAMPDSDFKTFILENMGKVTGDDERNE